MRLHRHSYNSDFIKEVLRQTPFGQEPPFTLADLAFVFNGFCQNEKISRSVGLERLVRQLANPLGLNVIFPEKVQLTTVVEYEKGDDRARKEHLGRQIGFASNLINQCSGLRSPVLIEIDSEWYVDVDAIFTTSTCPEAGGYDIVYPGDLSNFLPPCVACLPPKEYVSLHHCFSKAFLTT